MRVEEFDYELPAELIAQEPAAERDRSRLMVVHRSTGRIEHRLFRDLVEYLRPPDVLVLNETRVIPARLWGLKTGSSTPVEVLLLRPLNETRWEVLVRPGRRVKPGTELVFGDGLLVGRAVAVTPAGGRVMEFSWQGEWEEVLSRIGQMPLPPYIKKYPADPDRYQTVYARQAGSVAAPTAGLHFTPQLLEEIAARGIEIARILLHVGLGTFRPVRVEEVEKHRMHEEYFAVTPEAAQTINRRRAAGGRVVVVGTTSTRCLETVTDDKGIVHPGSGWTDLFIYPGYRFKAVDILVTNFHLPRSTLLMLVCAFADRDTILRAYRTAVAERYRFFSFGDAMLIL